MELFQKIVVTDVDELYTVRFPKGKEVQMRDRAYFGLSFCTCGQLTYTDGDMQVRSDPNYAILLPLGGNYHIHGDKDGVFPVINFLATDLPVTQVTALPLANPQSCLRDCRQLEDLLRQGGSRMQILSAFYSLLEKVSTPLVSNNDPLRPAMRYIEENLADPELTNEVLARQAGISEVYLQKRFRRQYHTSPKQYILELRIHHAKLALTGGDLTVTQIAERCGFSSVYHFCKVFKQRTGTTPSLYAATHRKDKI